MSSELRRTRDKERRERRRQELLDVAARVFSRKGYHGTLVSDIASEANVGQGTIYRYFKDKRDILDTLFEELVERVLSQFSEMSASLPSSDAEYREASVAALGRVVKELGRERELTHLIIREGPAIDHSFAEKLGSLYEQLSMLARFYLEHAIEEGFARPCDTKVVSQALVGIGVWMANLWCTGKLDDVALDDLVSEIVGFAFDGFGKPGDGQST